MNSPVDVVIVAFGAPAIANETAAVLRDVVRSVRIAATSPPAAASADLVLDNVGYGAAANAAFSQLVDRERGWFLVLNDDLNIDRKGAHAIVARLEGLDDDVAMWSFTGTSVGIAPRRRAHPAERAPHGAALAVRAAVFDAVGGFDPRHFLYGEEVDLWLRLPDGAASGYEDNDVVTHAGAASTGNSRVASFELGRGTGQLNRRHHNVGAAAGGVVMRTAHVAIRRRMPLAALAFAAGFVHGTLLPTHDGPAARRLGAAPRSTRIEIGTVR